MLDWTYAWSAEQPFKPEPGARLRFLRWSKFLDAENKATSEAIAAFSQVTNVDVRIENEWQDDHGAYGHRDALAVLLEWPGVRFDLRGLDGQTPEELGRSLGYSELADMIKAKSEKTPANGRVAAAALPH
jgi:hypothetical protein